MDLRFRHSERGDKSIRIEAVAAGDSGDVVAGWATLVPTTVRFPGAWVELAGVAGVYTAPAFRGKGVFRRVMDEVHRVALARGCPATILFGIPHLYHKIGYATTHVDVCVKIAVRDLASLAPAHAVRPLAEDDRAEVLRLYHAHVEKHTGAIMRNNPQAPLFPRGPRFGYSVRPVGVFDGERLLAYGVFDTVPNDSGASNSYNLHHVHLSELIGEDFSAVGAILAAAAELGRERRVEYVHVYVAPESECLRFLRLFGTVEETVAPISGGGMMRVLSPAGILQALAPTWAERLRGESPPWTGTLKVALSDAEAFPAFVRVSTTGAVEAAGESWGRGKDAFGSTEGAPGRTDEASRRTEDASLSVTSGGLAQLLIGFTGLAQLCASGKAQLSGAVAGVDRLFQKLIPPSSPFAYHATHV